MKNQETKNEALIGGSELNAGLADPLPCENICGWVRMLRQRDKDAERYRWLRDRLAIEDIERIEREFFGTPEEHESIKTDIAIDAAMAANAELSGSF